MYSHTAQIPRSCQICIQDFAGETALKRNKALGTIFGFFSID